MALFSYPRSDPADSFGLQLLKSILSTAAGSAVSGGIQGALGNYFEGKRADADLARNKVEKLDMAERVSNQNKALTERADVKDFLKDMPDKKRAWTIYQGLKDNPEMLTQDLGSVPGATPSPSGAAFFQKGAPRGQAAPQVIPQAMNPIDQYAREDPAGFSQWNMGKEARDTKNKGILEGMRSQAKVDAAGVSAGSREFVANQRDTLQRDQMAQQDNQFKENQKTLRSRIDALKDKNADREKSTQAALLGKAATMAYQASWDPVKGIFNKGLADQAKTWMNQALELTGAIDTGKGLPTMGGAQPTDAIPEPTAAEVKEVSALPAMAGKSTEEIVAIMKAKRAQKEGGAR